MLCNEGGAAQRVEPRDQEDTSTHQNTAMQRPFQHGPPLPPSTCDFPTIRGVEMPLVICGRPARRPGRPGYGARRRVIVVG